MIESDGLARLKGHLILPGDPQYESARRPAPYGDNPFTDKRPAIIVRCLAAEDVQRAVAFARERDLLTAVRSGGHSVAYSSTCEGGMVIDVSRMKHTLINSAARTGCFGGGVQTGELNLAAQAHGLATPIGECTTTGISGVTLGGGFGWLTPKFGAACDNLIAATVVTADARLVVANENENADLLWGLRGGGGNFGIATSLDYQLHPVDQVVAGLVVYPFRQARDGLRFFRDFMATAPDELTALAYVQLLDEPMLCVVACYSGEPEQGGRVLEPLRSLGRPLRDTICRRHYLDFAEAPFFDVPLGPNHVTSGFVPSLGEDVIERVLTSVSAAPARFSAIGLDHHMHGFVCRVDPAATAFNFREAGGYHFWVYSLWNSRDEIEGAIKWVEDACKELRSFGSGRIYLNYLGDEGEPAVKAAYGSNYDRLAALKAKYDPTNFFRLNQNIRPGG